MSRIHNRYGWAYTILGKHNAVFIAFAILTWITPSTLVLIFSDDWTLLVLFMVPVLFFPPFGLMVVLSIVAIRHYHPLMWLSSVPVATSIIWLVWLETPS